MVAAFRHWRSAAYGAVRAFDLARLENPPQLDIAQNVIGLLSFHKAARIAFYEKQMMWAALCSSAAAAVITIAAVVSYYIPSDPVTQVSQAISWVIK